MKTMAAHIVLVVLFSVFIKNTLCKTGPCGVCFCNSNGKIVYCSDKGLARIPQDIPSDTLRLMLNRNLFDWPRISRSNFTAFSLLQHLYISECGLEQISVGTFSDLRYLEWLDLSHNRLKVIEDFTFRGMTLEHLFLNGNHGLELRPNSFAGMSITGLYLHECSMKSLPAAILRPLEQLVNLWLNGNELTVLDEELSGRFATLTHLRITDNPLHCNCQLKWLKHFYDQHQTKFTDGKDVLTPNCDSPIYLKGQFFNQLQLDELVCQAPMMKNIDAVFHHGVEGLLRCSATGDPTPTIYWVQPRKQPTLFAPSTKEVNSATLNISALRNLNHELSGSYTCVAVNAAGNVTLTVNVSWPEPLAPPNTATSPTPIVSSINEPEEVEIIPEEVYPTNPDDISTPASVVYLPHNADLRFTLAQLITAVVVTFISTLLLCMFPVVLFYLCCKHKHASDSPEHNYPEPKSSQEASFLNNQIPSFDRTFDPTNYYDTLGRYQKQ